MRIENILIPILATAILTGCSRSQIGDFTPPANQIDTQTEKPLEFDTKNVDYQNTANWSKFSFSSFSLFLPKDFQVNGMNNDQSEISFANFALTPGKTYEPQSDKNHFSINIILTKPHSPIQDSSSTINDLSASKTTEKNKTIINISNPEQDTNYQLVFEFDFAANPELIDRILETLDFHKRKTLL